MKRTSLWSIFLTILCVAGLLLLLQPANAAVSPRFEWGMTDGGIEIFGVNQITTGNVTIPSTWNGEPVVAIGDSGFYGNGEITSLVISEGITLINSYAFCECSQLTSVTLPNSLQQLGYSAFTDCSELEFTVYGNGKYLGNNENPYLALVDAVSENTNVTVHKNTKVISESFIYMDNVKLSVEADNPHFSADSAGVLFNRDKTVLYWAPKWISGNYTIPNGVVEIKGDAFSNCDDLTGITVADSVKTIGDYAFSGNKAMKNFTLGEQVEHIGIGALNYCDQLEYKVYENGKYLGSKQNPYLLLVGVADRTVTQFRFHENTRVIGPGAFNSCSALTELTVPDSVVGIGDEAFWYCSALTKLSLGKGVRDIGEELFFYCDKLSGVIVDSGNEVYSSYDGVLYDKTITRLIQAPIGITGIYTVPDSVSRIEANAFFFCDQLSGIVFGKSVREIGADAFHGCVQLTELTIPGNVDIIGEYAFYECTGLTAVTLGEGVTTIGRRAFYCGAVSSLILPDSLTTIGWEAFGACDMTTVTIPKNVSWIDSDAFGSCEALSEICVAEENRYYCSHDGVLYDKAMTRLIQAPGGITRCVVPQGVQVIGESAFFECKKLKTVILPDSVTTIERAAFYDTGMGLIIIPASVTEMEEDAINGVRNVRFLGDVPEVIGRWAAIQSGYFDPKVNVYYPADNAAWEDETARSAVCNNANWVQSKDYVVTEGANTVLDGSAQSVAIGTEADSYYFIGLYIDGKWVDPDNYTVTDDTRIVLDAEYAATVKTGAHQVTLVFRDGDAKATLTVFKNMAGDLDGKNDVGEDDVIYLLQHLLMPMEFPVEQDVDYDNSGTVDEDDVIYLLQHLLMPEEFPL